MDVAQVLIAFLTEYPRTLALGDEPPAEVLDRYFAPGFTFRNNGMPLDRERLIAHARLVRRNTTDVDIDLAEFLVQERRFAARYLLRARMRSGETVTNAVYAFGEFDLDGKVTRIVQSARPMDLESQASE